MVNTPKFTLLLAICLFITCNGVKIFLLGGAVTFHQPDVYIAMAKATGRIAQPYSCSQDWATTTCPRVAVITSAAQNQQQGNHYYYQDQPNDSLSFKNLFNMFGYSPKHVSVHRDNYKRTTDLGNPEGQKNFEILKNADVIFFDGGDQIRHSLCWLTEEGKPNTMFRMILDRAIADKIILGGTSAGTMIWSNPAYGGGSSLGNLYFYESVGLAQKKISDGAIGGTGLHDVRNGTSGLQYYQNGAFFTGFGLLPFLLDTHFDKRGRLARIIPGLLQTKQEIGIGIDQPACLYYDNGIGTVYGQGGVFLVDIRKAYRNKKTYFTINNAQVSYLTVGDTFQFSENKLKPSVMKHKITIPQYKRQHDSNDILAPYQCTTLLTKLVDQIPNFNVGGTKKDQDFPHTAPNFILTFEKDANTVGYYSTTQKLYTIDKALLHITYR